MAREVPHYGLDIEGRPAVWLKGTEVVEATAEAFYQPHLESIAGPPRPTNHQVDVVAWMVPEPQNPHDPRAITLWVRGGVVGYMPRAHAAVWQPVILQLRARYGREVACFAKIVGGSRRASDGEGGHYAVRLFLPQAPL